MRDRLRKEFQLFKADTAWTVGRRNRSDDSRLLVQAEKDFEYTYFISSPLKLEQKRELCNSMLLLDSPSSSPEAAKQAGQLQPSMQSHSSTISM